MYYMHAQTHITHHELQKQVIKNAIFTTLKPISFKVKVDSDDDLTTLSIEGDVPDIGYRCLEALGDALTKIPNINYGVIVDSGERPQKIHYGQEFKALEEDLRERREKVMEVVKVCFPRIAEDVQKLLYE